MEATTITNHIILPYAFDATFIVIWPRSSRSLKFFFLLLSATVKWCGVLRTVIDIFFCFFFFRFHFSFPLNLWTLMLKFYNVNFNGQLSINIIYVDKLKYNILINELTSLPNWIDFRFTRCQNWKSFNRFICVNKFYYNLFFFPIASKATCYPSFQ